MKIGLFTPIVFAGPAATNTFAQKWQERIDEYFYLGGKPRACIMPPDAINPNPWTKDLDKESRSWISDQLESLSRTYPGKIIQAKS